MNKIEFYYDPVLGIPYLSHCILVAMNNKVYVEGFDGILVFSKYNADFSSYLEMPTYVVNTLKKYHYKSRKPTRVTNRYNHIPEGDYSCVHRIGANYDIDVAVLSFLLTNQISFQTYDYRDLVIATHPYYLNEFKNNLSI